ncbi:hypothetical protein [Pasteuria penetrans]|uniref:hypothetical protein n=1 Tax=Pasteuria penetrans TaxID=86005 RepID=UPI000F91DD1A|nr:hypothetical protein [Pasteuria penetrans]
MALSDMERETVIQFDESTNHATVYTASYRVARRLKGAGYQPIRRSQGSWWFSIPTHVIPFAGETKASQTG